MRRRTFSFAATIDYAVLLAISRSVDKNVGSSAAHFIGLFSILAVLHLASQLCMLAEASNQVRPFAAPSFLGEMWLPSH